MPTMKSGTHSGKSHGAFGFIGGTRNMVQSLINVPHENCFVVHRVDSTVRMMKLHIHIIIISNF